MTLEELLELGAVFQSKGWQIEDSRYSLSSGVFDKFCRMLLRLSPNQRKLTLKLIPDYLWLPSDNWGKSLIDAWDAVHKLIPANTPAIYIAPLLKPNARAPKSSHTVWRKLKERQHLLQTPNEATPLRFVRTHKKDIKKRTNSHILVLCDDFIGSGQTAREALQVVRASDPSRNNDNTIVCALAAQRGGIDLLAPLAKVGHAIERVRCISDNNSLGQTPSPIEIAKEIGRMLHFPEGDRLGYSNTEALVTTDRTANNTLPMFWTNRKVGSAKWPAPFPRGNDRET